MNSSSKKTRRFITEQIQWTLRPFPIQVIKYDLNQYNDSLYSTFNIDQPDVLNQWVMKRKAQFLAGRIAAQYALKAINANSETIPIGKHREPLWGDNIVGSISHSDGVSIATAQMKKSDNHGIGLDIQTILSDQEIIDSTSVVLMTHDKALLEKGIPNYSYNQLFSLLFSAKESFFKATFKEVGKHFDFDVVSLKSIDFESETLLLKCEKMLSKNIARDSEFLIHFTYLDIKKPLVITYFQFL